MDTRLTVRVDVRLRRALQARADAQRMSLSALIRSILTNAIAATTVGERVASLKGSLQLPRKSRDRWRIDIRRHNWRPGP